MVAEGAEVSGQALAASADVVAHAFAVDTRRAGLAAGGAKKAGRADCGVDTHAGVKKAHWSSTH